jgi:hypothetical protein
MASIKELSRFTGSWKGNGLGGIVHEEWSKPEGDSMAGYFKLIKDGATKFYEFLIIEQEGDEVTYSFRHYNRGLEPWEEQPLVFRLAKLTENEAVFEAAKEFNGPQSLTYSFEGNNLTVRVTQKDNTYFDVPFSKE